jgi:YggT family protein
VLCALLNIYLLLIFGRIILSWFPISPGSALASIYSILYTITEPVLGPIRRVMPTIGFGGMGLDLSPIIVIFAVQLLIIPTLSRANLC